MYAWMIAKSPQHANPHVVRFQFGERPWGGRHLQQLFLVAESEVGEPPLAEAPEEIGRMSFSWSPSFGEIERVI